MLVWIGLEVVCVVRYLNVKYLIITINLIGIYEYTAVKIIESIISVTINILIIIPES